MKYMVIPSTDCSMPPSAEESLKPLCLRLKGQPSASLNIGVGVTLFESALPLQTLQDVGCSHAMVL